MISVLIPVYNFDVRNLVYELSQQLIDAGIKGQVICVDDGSASSFIETNKEIDNDPVVTFEVLDSNIGRSAIRNKLANMASHPNLLFIDCDSACPTNMFITNYSKHLSDYEVLYGGRAYADDPPTDDRYFRWYYGQQREVTPAEHRKKSPYKSFMTNNFMIKKDLFQDIRFNENLTQYGHEDTLFGLELLERNITITHIDNPLVHIGLEATDDFLEKSRKAIENLLYLYRQNLISGKVKLLTAYKFLERTNMVGQVAKRYKNKSGQWIENFRSPSPNLKLFDLYKLGYMCYLSETASSSSSSFSSS